jgi:hypothetical protein
VSPRKPWAKDLEELRRRMCEGMNSVKRQNWNEEGAKQILELQSTVPDVRGSREGSKKKNQ